MDLDLALDFKLDKTRLNETIMEYLLRHNLQSTAKIFESHGVHVQIEEKSHFEKMIKIYS